MGCADVVLSVSSWSVCSPALCSPGPFHCVRSQVCMYVHVRECASWESQENPLLELKKRNEIMWEGALQ